MKGGAHTNPAAVTALLARAHQGDGAATEELFPLVYDELRDLADRYLTREQPGHTLQPTALVHEAYLRLVGPAGTTWENRRHFFAAAAKAIRRILIDHARGRGRDKRGGGVRPEPIPKDAVATTGVDLDLLALDEALRRLAELNAQIASVVEMRFFVGLSAEDTAQSLGVSLSTVMRHWRFARSWLYREMGGGA